MRRVLIYLLTLASGAALAVSAAQFLVDRGVGRAPAEAGRPAGRVVPAAGQTLVTGTIERLTATGAQAPPLGAPITLTALGRGEGRATIENALVDGERTTIFWGGGTALPLSSGAGGVDLAGATVEVDEAGARWLLAGARPLLPGDYQAQAPVAVGIRGLAESQDSVSFTADERTVLNATEGVVVELGRQRLEVTGPGRVSITGTLTVNQRSGTRSATAVELAEGPYRVVVEPEGSRLELDATLQGPVTLG